MDPTRPSTTSWSRTRSATATPVSKARSTPLRSPSSRLSATTTFTPGYDPGDAQGSVLSGEQDFVGRDVAQMLRTGTDEDYRTLLVLADEPHDLAPDAMTLSDLRDEYDADIPEQEIFQLGFPIGTTPGTPDEVVDELADAVTHLIDEDEEFQEWLDENHMSESVLSERIGREVTQEYVANVAYQYAEFGIDDIEDRLQSAE